MNLKDYLASPESKYAVIRLDSYTKDPVAQSLSPEPRTFVFDGIDMVIISLDPSTIVELATYATQVASGIEFKLTVGSNKVTLLTHSQALAIMAEYQSTIGG